MRRVATKTYGRNTKDTFASQAFDAVFKDVSRPSTATKAASTIQRWGKASFTSTRGNVVDNETSRKRKLDASPPQPPADSLFDDPFSFDSDDDGPKKPQRGMGYKPDDEDSADKMAKRSVAGRVKGSSKLKRDENDEEKDTIKNIPSRTYSKMLLHGKSDSGSSSGGRSKQLSIAAFGTRQSNARQDSSLSSSSSQGTGSQRKFFSSVVSSQNSSSQRSALFDDNDDCGDTDMNPALDSGDPEIVFNMSGQQVMDSDGDTDSVNSEPHTTTKGRFFTSYSRPPSVASNGSAGSMCDRLRWDNRPVIKISSLDREDKTDKPLIRRLLTSPSKVLYLLGWGC